MPGIYEALGVELQKVFDDKTKTVFERYSTIEDKFQETFTSLLYPASDSNLAKIREKILQEAVADIKSITFPKG
ncbi:hypothetical protein KBC03_07165 [Patescibacteria group bacterium]|nr:hypothetical protein [Patescibacteria group bacterium]